MLFVIAAATLVLFSCDRTDDNPSSPSVSWGAGYIPVYPGNYWIYEHYRIDTLGNEILQNDYDSIVVTGTTLQGGKSYIVFEGNWMSGSSGLDTVLMLRDSSGYYVDPGGRIHFSYVNFDDTLHTYLGLNNNTGDTLYDSWYKMEQEPQWVVVPAGTYEALSCRGTILTYHPNFGVPPLRYTDEMYSKNVGMVLDTYYYLGSPVRFERRLKRYQVSDLSIY